MEDDSPEIVTVAQVATPEETVLWKDEIFKVDELVEEQGKDLKIASLRKHVLDGSVPDKREVVGFPKFERFYRRKGDPEIAV